MFLELLETHIRQGRVRVHLPGGGVHEIGAGEQPIDWYIHDEKAMSRIARDPELEVGETYLEGLWDTGDLPLEALLILIIRNFQEFRRKPASTLRHRAARLFQRANRIARSYRNVALHYDLDEWLFRHFLDRGMFYSCAYFHNPDMTLEEAQVAKCRHLMKKLRLRPGQKVLDIGCGWGGLALYLAERANVEVTGLTLSREQLRVAQAEIQKRGMGNLVKLLLQDYREHDGRYDRVVSVGMFEHVGPRGYPQFFGKVRDLLANDGIAVLHTIGSCHVPQETNAWIRRHIFPGGYIPSLSEVCAAAERAALVISDVEVLRLHYAFTLAEWLKRFRAQREAVLERMGERFVRMWEFYLASSEASFRAGDNLVFQIQLARENDSVPLVRDYLYLED